MQYSCLFRKLNIQREKSVIFVKLTLIFQYCCLTRYWCLFRKLTIQSSHICLSCPFAMCFHLSASRFNNSFQYCQSAITSSSYSVIFLCIFIIFWDTETLKMSCFCQVSRQNVSPERAINISIHLEVSTAVEVPSSVHTEPWKLQNDRRAAVLTEITIPWRTLTQDVRHVLP